MDATTGSATTSVYRRLRELIVGGAYPAGASVPESQLAAHSGVSRTPVREALRRLEADGLVDLGGRGVRILARSQRELLAVYQVRAALEALCAGLAAERQRAGLLAPARLAAVRDLARADQAALASGDLAGSAESNRRFHRAIASLSGNAVALEMLDRLWDQIVVSIRDVLVVRERADAVQAEHEEVLGCLERGDAAGAAEAARRHVLATAAALGVPDESWPA